MLIENNIYKVNHSVLSVGLVLPWDVFDEHGQLLLKAGSVIKSERQIDQLIDRNAVTRFKIPESRQPLANGKTHPFLIWEMVEESATNLSSLTDPDAFAGCMEGMVLVVQGMIEDNLNGTLAAMLLIHHRSYAVGHALHVALLASIISERLKFDTRTIIQAALTMNISMMDLQQTLYHQVKPLTPEQRAAVQSHPERSVAMLKERGVTDTKWLQLVASHHEPDYPTKTMQGEEALLLHIADIYSAKFSGRGYRQGISPETAILATLRPFKEHRVMHQLMKVVGVFPPGLLLKLTDGSMGLVMNATDDITAPNIAVVVDPNGNVVSGKKRRVINKSEIVAVVPRTKVAATFPYAELYESNTATKAG